MLTIIVRLKQRYAQVQLKHDAANRPDIARLRPAKLENHFGRTIMTRADNRAVMLMIEGRAAKVDESDVGAFHATNFAILQDNHNGLDKLSTSKK